MELNQKVRLVKQFYNNLIDDGIFPDEAKQLAMRYIEDYAESDGEERKIKRRFVKAVLKRDITGKEHLDKNWDLDPVE